MISQDVCISAILSTEKLTEHLAKYSTFVPKIWNSTILQKKKKKKGYKAQYCVEDETRLPEKASSNTEKKTELKKTTPSEAFPFCHFLPISLPIWIYFSTSSEGASRKPTRKKNTWISGIKWFLQRNHEWIEMKQQLLISASINFPLARTHTNTPNYFVAC